MSSEPQPLSLFNLPNDLLILILEYFSLSDHFNFFQFTELLSPRQSFDFSSYFPHAALPPPLPPQGDSNPTDPLSNLLHLLRHRDGILFRRFALDSPVLQWLQIISVKVTKLRFKDYNGQSHQYVMQYKDSVEELDFHFSPKLLNKYLNQLGHCPRLTSLSLATCAKINDSTLQQFLKSNPQLERLNISAAPKITSQILPAPHSYGQNLQYLDVSKQEWFDEESLRFLVTSWSRLKSINFSGTSVQLNSAVELLKTKPRIQSIGYSMSPMYLGEADRIFLMNLALRSVMSDDLVSQNLGLGNLSEFFEEDDVHYEDRIDVDRGIYFEMIRSAGIMPRIFRSTFDPELRYNALRTLLFMSASDQLVKRAIVEDSLIPHLVSLALQFKDGIAANILGNLAEVDEYCSLILSSSRADLLSEMVKIPCSAQLLGKLSRQAFPDQLIPVYSFILTQVLIEMASVNHLVEFPGSYSEYEDHRFRTYDSDEDDDDRRIYPSHMLLCMFEEATPPTEVLESVSLVSRLLSAMSAKQINRNCLERCFATLSLLFVRDTAIVVVNGPLLSTWHEFLTQAPPANKKKSIIGSIIVKIITQCSDLRLVIASGLISSFFSLMESRTRDQFIEYFLDMVNHAVNARSKICREEAVTFLDHLVDMRMLSSLVGSATSKEPKTPLVSDTGLSQLFATVRKDRLRELAQGLKMIVTFDQKYESLLKDFIANLEIED